MDRRSFFKTVGGGLVLTPALALRTERPPEQEVTFDPADMRWDAATETKLIAAVFWLEDTEGRVHGRRSVWLSGPAKMSDGSVRWEAIPQHYEGDEIPACTLEHCVVAVQWEDLIPPEAGLPLHGEKLFRTPLGGGPCRWAAIRHNTITVDRPSITLT